MDIVTIYVPHSELSNCVFTHTRVHALRPLQLYHMFRPMWPAPQSEQNYHNKNISSVLPFYNHIYVPHPISNLAITNSLSSPFISLFWECYVSGIILYVTFWDWFFHWAQFPWDLPKLQCVLVICSFLLLSSIPRYRYAVVSLVILALKGIWFFPVFTYYQ